MNSLTLHDVYNLSRDALIGAGATESIAHVVAQSITDAEADGIRLIGLDYLPVYCRHLNIGKVVGNANPVICAAGKSGLMIDACNGFCHSAFVAGEEQFYKLSRACGISAMGIRNSYASGVLGWFSDRIAQAGFIGLAFTNASPTMAPFGGSRPVFGTNPLALGVPRKGHPPLLIDQSPAATTRLAIKAAQAAGENIPEGWGLDGNGAPSTDPNIVLEEGTVALSGGHKGGALVLLVELLAAGLTGANWSFEASDLGDDSGGPPGIGQFFIAIHPETFSGPAFLDRIEVLIEAMLEQDGVRLPGDRRHQHRVEAEKNGVMVPDELLSELKSFVRQG